MKPSEGDLDVTVSHGLHELGLCPGKDVTV